MLDSLLDRFRGRTSEKSADDDRLVPLAAATLLFEVAWADHDISPQERSIVETAIQSQFDLNTAQIDAIMAEARAYHEQSVGLQAFTRTLVEAWDEPERFELVMQLWRLAYSDARLDRFEEHTIRKIAELLYVSHTRFIEAKRLARDHQ